MLYSEFREQDLGCDECPIKHADLCSGAGMVCYGNTTIDPPCCWLEDDTDMDEWVESKLESIRRYEESEDKRIRAQKEKKAKNKLTQERRRESQYFVRQETREITRLKKRIMGNEAIIRLADTVRIVNSMFSEIGTESEKRHPLVAENEQIRVKIKEIEALKKQKLKDFRKQREQRFD